MMPRKLRWLRLLAAFEFASLMVLLGNVALLHNATLAAALGPVHGAAYLSVIIGLLIREATPARVRWLSVVPGIGGFLALRTLEAP